MAAGYFGDFTPAVGRRIWAEIQFTGWMIDGGVLMIALYCGALVVTTLTQWKVAMTNAVSAARRVRGRGDRAPTSGRR